MTQITKHTLEGNCQYQIVCPTKKGMQTITDKERVRILDKFNTFINNEPLVIVYDVQITSNYIYVDMKADPSVNMHEFVNQLRNATKLDTVTYDRKYLITRISMNRP